MKVTLRYPEELHERLTKVAALERRSLNAEIVVRLEQSLGWEPQAEGHLSRRPSAPVTAAVHDEPPSRPKRVRDVAPPLQEKFKPDFKPGKKVS